MLFLGVDRGPYQIGKFEIDVFRSDDLFLFYVSIFVGFCFDDFFESIIFFKDSPNTQGRACSTSFLSSLFSNLMPVNKSRSSFYWVSFYFIDFYLLDRFTAKKSTSSYQSGAYSIGVSTSSIFVAKVLSYVCYSSISGSF